MEKGWIELSISYMEPWGNSVQAMSDYFAT